MEISFEAYLTKKKINSEAFLQTEPEMWKSLKLLFEQVHVNSFEMQKKFLINDIRRKYLLK